MRPSFFSFASISLKPSCCLLGLGNEANAGQSLFSILDNLSVCSFLLSPLVLAAPLLAPPPLRSPSPKRVLMKKVFLKVCECSLFTFSSQTLRPDVRFAGPLYSARALSLRCRSKMRTAQSGISMICVLIKQVWQAPSVRMSLGQQTFSFPRFPYKSDFIATLDFVSDLSPPLPFLHELG